MNFNTQENIYLGISRKADGPMKGRLENQNLFFNGQGLNDKILVLAGLAHGNKVFKVEKSNSNVIIPDCDALISNQDNFLLAITVADCLPIYFYDNNKKVVAIAHAGWRGVLAEIVSEVIKTFIDLYESQPEDIEVFIGPHIKDCHFEVQEDVSSKFRTLDSVARNGQIFVNLAQVVKEQLLDLGVASQHINISDDCTYCLDDKYFSFRRDKPENLETMIAYIGLK